jgi:glutamate--cysteine ligase
LEIRYLDSVADELWPAVVFALVTLLDDPVAAEVAAAAVEPVAARWDTAARIGLRDRRLHSAAKECIEVAAARLPDTCGALLAESMRRLLGLIEQGRCPGDEFADRVVENGIVPTVARLAQGEL